MASIPCGIIADFVFGSRFRLPVTTTQIPSRVKGGQNVKPVLTYVYNEAERHASISLLYVPLSLQPEVKTTRI
jgi:hypothetical protein